MLPYQDNIVVFRVDLTRKNERVERTSRKKVRAAPYTKERKRKSKPEDDLSYLLRTSDSLPHQLVESAPAAATLLKALETLKAANPQRAFPNDFYTCNVYELIDIMKDLTWQLNSSQLKKYYRVFTWIFRRVFDKPGDVKEWLRMMIDRFDLLEQFIDKGEVEDATFGKFAHASHFYVFDDWVKPEESQTSAPAAPSLPPSTSHLPMPIYTETTTLQAPVNAMENVPMIEPSWDAPYTQNIGHSQRVSYNGSSLVEATPVQFSPPFQNEYTFYAPNSSYPADGYTLPVSDASNPLPHLAYQQVAVADSVQSFLPLENDNPFYAPNSSYPTYGGTSPVSDASDPSLNLAHQQMSFADPSVGMSVQCGGGFYGALGRQEEPLPDYLSDQVLVNEKRGYSEVVTHQQQVVQSLPSENVPDAQITISGASNRAGPSSFPEPANGYWDTEAFLLDSLSVQQPLNENSGNDFNLFNNSFPSSDLDPLNVTSQILSELPIDFSNIAEVHPADLQTWPWLRR